MSARMPRGAIPTRRSELAASEPYRPAAASKIFVPGGEFPTPNHDLAGAQPYRAAGTAPESFVAWPVGIASLEDEQLLNSIWAEEAFAKACADPTIFIPSDVIIFTARKCGSSNFSEFVQTHGFQMAGKAYLDGPFSSVDWTNSAALNGAIANVGPVKIGIASANRAAGWQGQVAPGASGWAVHSLLAGRPKTHCASLFGYGPLTTLVDRFERNGVSVTLPSRMPMGLCYALFTAGSIGIIDRQSMMNITGEAWVRIPTTIVKNLSG